jgi:hypothetical protein
MRRFGIEPASAVAMAQRDQSAEAVQRIEPLPTPTGAPPYRLSASKVKPGMPTDKRVIHIIGDHGGIKDPHPQLNVAAAMVADAATNGVDYCYSVGDVVYFNGAKSEYPNQFQEPYAHYNLPIFAIPGNHDGEISDPAVEPSLQAFVRYFCDVEPQLRTEVAEFHRDSMDQPNVYWTLEDDLVTIIGLYTNVPSGGVVRPDQAAWLVGELEHAPTDRALIVALHHPCYSCDAHHGGSAKMGQVLDRAFAASKRTPDLVLAGHVHDYQRFTRTLGGRAVPYIVCGASGYPNLHRMAHDAAFGLQATPDCVLASFEAAQWGFLRLTVATAAVEGEYVAVAKDGTVTPGIDRFKVPVGVAS